jgi:hypothetical protein
MNKIYIVKKGHREEDSEDLCAFFSLQEATDYVEKFGSNNKHMRIEELSIYDMYNIIETTEDFLSKYDG